MSSPPRHSSLEKEISAMKFLTRNILLIIMVVVAFAVIGIYKFTGVLIVIAVLVAILVGSIIGFIIVSPMYLMKPDTKLQTKDKSEDEENP